MNRVFKVVLSIFVSLIIGAVNGFFGGGGGMLLVPFLVYGLSLGQKEAHATAIPIILPVSIASGITYIIKSGVNIPMLISTIIGSVTGGIIGATLLKKLPQFFTGILFSILMIIAGVRMCI